MAYYLKTDTRRSSRTLENAYPRFLQARLGHRYCNPTTGRWLSRDPIGEVGFLRVFSQSLRLLQPRVGFGFTRNDIIKQVSPNAYEFVEDSPPNRRDALGLQSESDAGKNCKPECEMKAIRGFRDSAEQNADLASKGFIPQGQTGVVLAKTSCAGGVPDTDWKGTDVKTCEGKCVYAHEMVHHAQCVKQPWGPGNLYYEESQYTHLGVVMPGYETEHRLVKAKQEEEAYRTAAQCYRQLLTEGRVNIKYGTEE